MPKTVQCERRGKYHPCADGKAWAIKNSGRSMNKLSSAGHKRLWRPVISNIVSSPFCVLGKYPIVITSQLCYSRLHEGVGEPLTNLEYRFTNDVLFKWLFARHQDLLKRLVAGMLGVPLYSITEFVVTNPNIPPEAVGEKLCRLDISMIVDGRRIGLEVQVANEGDYPERSLYYWAREYSTALEAGGEYIDLPRTIIISILGFKLFDCDEHYSEHMVLEVTRHTLLTDRLCLKYYELPKLPDVTDSTDELKLWLALFNAKTEEDLKRIEDMEVPVMTQAITAYRAVTAADEFRQLERMRADARNIEASALGHARREAMREADEKWQGMIAEKDAALAEKDAALTEKDAEIERLRAQLEKHNS